MLKYTINRILLMVLTVFLVLTILFLLIELMPGSPFNDPKITETQREIMEDQYGLNEPLLIRYVTYIGNVLQGDLGVSFKYKNLPITTLLMAPLRITMAVGLSAVFFGTVIGIILGALAALNRGTWIDNLVTFLSVVGTSIPSFVFATFLIIWASDISWLPVTYRTASESLGITYGEQLLSMIMPIFTLSIFIIAYVMRFTRSELIEVMSSDYILLARAKGTSKSKVVYKHALRNALIPVITIVGPMTIYAVTGSTVIERFFGVPGLAQQLINAVNTMDIFLILGITLLYTCVTVFVLFVIDMLYGVIDPRVRVAGGSKGE